MYFMGTIKLALTDAAVQLYLGQISEPCCISDPQLCQKHPWRLKSISTSSQSSLHGCGLSHSFGLHLEQSYVVYTIRMYIQHTWKVKCHICQFSSDEIY